MHRSFSGAFFLGGEKMTYGQIFSEIYSRNKRYIFFCITLCIVFSMLFYGKMTAVNAVEVDEMGLVAEMGGTFGEALAPIMSSGVFGGIDISWVMIIICASSLGATYGGSAGITGLDRLSGFSFGIFERPTVCIVLLIWFGVPLILKAFSKTNAAGVALETEQKKFNGVIMILVVMSQILSNVYPEYFVDAASETVSNAVRSGFSALACLAVLLITLVIYFLVRYLFSLLDIIMVPVCTLVPFVSFLWLFAKLAFIGLMILLAVYLPGFYIVLSAVLIIVAALLFRTAYMAVRYFENIYVKALFKKIFGGYDKNKQLIAPKLPAKVREFIEGRQVQMVIPVYVLREFPNLKGMRKWDRFWMISENGYISIIKPLFGKKGCHQIPLYGTPAQKMFINAYLPYYEIFNIYGSEEAIAKTFKKVPKMFHIVFSKEYFYRYQEIKNITGFVDYAEYKQYLKNYYAQPRVTP